MELHMSEFMFADFLRSIVEIFWLRAQQKGITFLYETISKLPDAVRGDEQKLRQILINLLGNAVKFTDQGGVVFKVGYIDSGQIRFQVEDTGVGIPHEQLDEIFQPFQQVGDQRHLIEGTGLGLPISQRLVEMMDSTLNVNSVAGKGTTFWLDLDLPEVENWHRIPYPSDRPISGYQGDRRTILVADDKWENRSFLMNLLIPLGFKVTEAVNGEDCISQAIQVKPDLILMDLVMPVLDGFEATRKLRQSEHLHEVVILAASASAFDNDQQQSLASGCNDFISKPIQAQELLEKLRKHLNLEWLYKDDGISIAIPFPSNDRLGDRSNGDRLLSASTPLPTPCPDELANLMALAKIGDIGGILERIQGLEQSDHHLIPFTEELRQLAKNFQVKKIQAFLKTFMVDVR